MTDNLPRVLIIGGGFGGLFAAKRLRRAKAHVTLLDRSTTSLFQPLLYQCATGLLSEGQISSPLRSLLKKQKNLQVLQGEAATLDPEAQLVMAVRPDGRPFTLRYDCLIIAVGMQKSYFGHDEFAQWAPGMKTLDDALAVRRRIYGAFEWAETAPTPQERTEWLTFAVVGAGPTGVELAGQIREVATNTLAREFRDIDPSEARVLLFEGGDVPLASFAPRLTRKTNSILEGLGVETHYGVMVTDVDETGLTTKTRDGSTQRYDARTVLWTAGVRAVPFVDTVARALSVEQDRSGRIPVNPDLTVIGYPNIWAVGDIINLDNLPGVAEVALQGGLHAGGQIKRILAGKPHPHERFKYRDLGSAAYISRLHAVVDAGPLKLSGFLGWLVWGFIHLAFLAGVRNRVSTLSTWLFTLMVGKRRERPITFGDPTHAEQPYQHELDTSATPLELIPPA